MTTALPPRTVLDETGYAALLAMVGRGGVAVAPDLAVIEDGGEVGTVTGPGGGQHLADGGSGDGVGAGTGCVPGRGEEPEHGHDNGRA